MASIIKVDQIQSDTGNVSFIGNIKLGANNAIPQGTLDVGGVGGTSPGDLVVTTGSTTATVTVGRLSGTSDDNTHFRVRNRVDQDAFFVNAGNRTANVGLTFAVGGATPATTGSGITFPASQNASSDPNTLDDYEEGTWTPTVQGSSTAGTYTLSNIKAYYIKVGNQVTVWCSFGFSAASGGSGNIRILGLPFNYKSLSTGAGPIHLGAVDLPTGAIGVVVAITSSGSTNNIFPITQKDNANGDEIPISGVTTSSGFSFNFTYTVA